ncbi:LacI family DNA-binding transcriptional regulator [Streptomyces odontomachi]|uniref:LacI family DNA-binding transcriptional regulator n=1 Tax=Streptomyces odontomachi TaxID=2944940 RepID=UPI00210957AA|nr:LacI family DNA-binding transcriptional regulator [Streptomyces sp. ODS25]
MAATDKQVQKAGIRALRVSAADVARAVGVSPATVSYVLNGRDGVSQEMRERVLKTAQELGHIPSARARRLREQRTRVIGLVLTDIANPFYTEIAAGTVDSARARGYEVFFAHTQENAETLDNVIDTMIARNVDGVVLTVLHPDDGEVIRRIRRAHIPFVQLSRRIPFLEADFVGIDDSAAAVELMHHVLDHGYEDVALVAGPRNSTASAARVDGFRAAARARRIPLPADRITSTYLSEAGGRRAASRLLDADPLPRAIVCGSDAIAAGVIGALALRGVRVPEDVAVTGFDGLFPEASPLAALTTVNQPRRDMAGVALDLLVHRIDGVGGAYQSLIQPHELRIGTTCGCPLRTEPIG